MKPQLSLFIGTLCAVCIVYYALPLLVFQQEGIAWFLLLVVNPLICMISGILFGIFSGMKQAAILYPFLVGAAFFPSIFLFYNDSALIYLPVYLCACGMGVAIGWIIHLKK